MMAMSRKTVGVLRKVRCRDVLSRKTAGVLERYGVETLGDVSGYTADEMLALRGVGQTSLNEVMSVMRMAELPFGYVVFGDTLDPRPVSDLQGLGTRVRGAILRMGIETVGQLASTPRRTLLGVKGFGAGSLAEIDVSLTAVGHGPAGSPTWAAAWRGGTVTPADIFAAVDALTAEEQLAEATAFVLEAAADDICGEIDSDSLFQLSDLADEEDVHVRCYVAMCRARSRTVAEESCPGCFKFDGLVCPEHRVTCLYDDCIFCGGCGNAHGYCKCSSKERAKRDAGRHHVLV